MKQWAIQQPVAQTYKHLGVWLCSKKTWLTFFSLCTEIISEGIDQAIKCSLLIKSLIPICKCFNRSHVTTHCSLLLLNRLSACTSAITPSKKVLFCFLGCMWPIWYCITWWSGREEGVASSDGMRTFVGSFRPTGPASCPTANAPSPGTAPLLAPSLCTAQPFSNQVCQK